ncbi:MAG: hypothetical protein BXU00_01440 [Candidatus Nanoclepta minutus]|uniref:CRISPR-associated protein Cas5 n=1 Tax=Candidatus Nanoclepta minutus TaxID=1940235 RepID=A0A397WNC0_9ARCH|nr:MAG: hypothetical protein BXU00_01440 [Candidatus Nanoclepta minutus]
MNKERAYILEIEFPLAFFKIPYTVKTRKTFLIPRKKAIFSIFNAFFKEPISFWKIKKRNKSKEEENILKNFLVGSELLTFEKTIEIQRIIQIKSKGFERPPSNTELIVNSKYIFYLVPKEVNLEIDPNPINYYPFAGQNDYLAYSWKLESKEGTIEEKNEINIPNYQLVPSDLIDIYNSRADIIVENALERFIVAKGILKFKEEVKVLKINSKEIILL